MALTSRSSHDVDPNPSLTNPNPYPNPNCNPHSNVKPSPNPSPNFNPNPNHNPNQDSFHDVAPAAKVSAIADNLAAALGVACQQPHLRSALVIVLGTAPAVATIFRDPSGKGKFIETAIWQSWVWLNQDELSLSPRPSLSQAYAYA